MNVSILSLDKGQDFGMCGKTTTIKGEEMEWMVGCDGHGTDHIINILRELNWEYIMARDDSLKLVLDIIDSHWKQCPGSRYASSGATYMEAKIFKNRIETCAVGDSKIMVFMDDKLCYENTEHNIFNPLEQVRIQHRIIKTNVVVPFVLTPSNITGVTKHYHVFEDGTNLAMTQALGHNRITGIQAERKVIPFGSENKMRVLLMSDGVSDMLSSEPKYYQQDLQLLAHLSADEITNFAEQRWKQDWHLYEKKEDELFTHYSFATPNSRRSGFDDVMVVVCDILPTQKEAVVEAIVEAVVEAVVEKEYIEQDKIALDALAIQVLTEAFDAFQSREEEDRLIGLAVYKDDSAIERMDFWQKFIPTIEESNKWKELDIVKIRRNSI